MHSLPKVFAAWRLQAETVAGILQDRKLKRSAKQLKAILKQIDQIWMTELGEPYVQELVHLIDLMEEGPDLSSSTAETGEASGVLIPFGREGERP